MKAFWAKVKAFFAKIAEFFENPDGGMSSRRLFGGGLIVVAVVLAFHGRSDMVVLSFLGTGTLLLGLTTVDGGLLQLPQIPQLPQVPQIPQLPTAGSVQ